ncbi:MAG: iron-containing alcohol dehydrogenase [Bacillota bacterium]
MEMIFGAPQYYVQGPGILRAIPRHMAALEVKRRTLIIMDPGVVGCVQHMFDAMDTTALPYTLLVYDKSIHLDNIYALIQTLDRDYDCVLGVGGGKAIDVAKRVGWALQTRLITVPTSVASDACTSRTAVSYGKDGEIVEDKTLFNPACVLVDSAVIVGAPFRLFCAGMADAISKRFEYKLSLKCAQKNWYDGDPAFFINDISEKMHLLLLKEGRYLADCFRRHELNDTVEKAITAMFLMSRFVWDPGGLRGAHDMFEEYHDCGYGPDVMHGEMVGFFDLVQLLLEDYPENEFEELYMLYSELHIPLKLSDMGFPVEDEAKLYQLTQRMLSKCAKFNYHPSAEKFKDIIYRLEAR